MLAFDISIKIVKFWPANFSDLFFIFSATIAFNEEYLLNNLAIYCDYLFKTPSIYSILPKSVTLFSTPLSLRATLRASIK